MRPRGGCLISNIGGMPGNILPGWKRGGTMPRGFGSKGIPVIPGMAVGRADPRELIPGRPGRGGKDSGPVGLVGKEDPVIELVPEPGTSAWPRERLSKLPEV